MLKELHILTREGRLNQDSRRKLKQVYHLFQFIEKLLRELPGDGAQATLADHGAGKSYLGFIIYDLFFKQGGTGHVYGIETRADLVQKSRGLAELWRHPLHTREIGSQLTNVLRCLYLEANGYQVTVTELVGWEHSMKNELIIARHTGQRKASAAERLRELLEQFGLASLLETRFRLP